MFNPITEIDRRIEDLQRMKNNYNAMPQQPINIYNNTNSQNNDFEARYLKENEKVEEILIQKKTAFIDLKNRQLSVKEIDGNIISYEIVLPKDEKDLEIERLKEELNELKSNKANTSIRKSERNDKQPDKE